MVVESSHLCFVFVFSLLHIVRLNIDKNYVPDLNCTEFHNRCVIILTRKQSLNLKKLFSHLSSVIPTEKLNE